MLLSDITRTLSVKLNLLENDGPDTSPEISFVVLDEKDKPLERVTAKHGGTIKLDPKVLRKASAVALLPGGQEGEPAALRDALRLTPDQVAELVQPNGELTLSPDRWRPLFPFFRCLDGRVEKCWWWPWFVQVQNNRVALRDVKTRPTGNIGQLSPTVIETLRAPRRDLSIFPSPLFPRCRPVCLGRIEVYRRQCCRRIVVLPTDILAICERLKRIRDLIPVPKPIPPVGPVPEPDPVPFAETGMFKGGVLDALAVHAEDDLAAIDGVPFEVAREHVLRHPRLSIFLNDCSEPVRVGTGTIGPDGEFSICFPEFPIILPSHCHLEYAFKVIQPRLGGEITIYDGVAADVWFSAGDEIVLRSFHPLGRDCIPDDGDHGEPDVYLRGVGTTDAWHLQPHQQDVTGPVTDPIIMSADTGLVGRPGVTGSQRPQSDNCNWGGTLDLFYFFPDSLKALGARFYRVSVQQVNNAGNAIGAPVYLDEPVSWRYYDGSDSTKRDPLNHPADATFYEIPYRRSGGEQWDEINPWHTRIRTSTDSRFASRGKFAVTLELYRAGAGGAPGARLVPNGALNNTAGHQQAAFEFGWRSEAGPITPKQPFIGLTHVLWWDNRKATAEIVDLRINGTPDNSECQFVVAPGNATVTAGIRAFHPEPRFLDHWDLNWHKGIGGGPVAMASETENFGVAGAEPADKNQMGPELTTIAEMLGTMSTAPFGPEEKCAFGMNLYVLTKTWNGRAHQTFTDERDEAAFALENQSLGS